ncbi:Ubiquinone biosynthesis O-methyltransferase, mitochondrial [Campylobacter suis]|uniref:Ubiquinone biosynthesis O-methyltransferase, mitochondrial n=1 Tax=Campylobacter suis TaxID=2790657 RepID=A0ABN7K8X1_9BACT|nr:Ubiquinone biosynthesis O-methyltransferase, mitochondrial [Campylobacter suis]
MVSASRAHLWDKKSNKYPRFDGFLTEFGGRVFEILDSWDVSFSEKSVVDVGCGTGVYTLYIAKTCTEILGIDSSFGMLEILKEDAQKFNVKNLSTSCATFDEANLEKYYDIALCTMSPAIKSKENFIKFNSCAKQKIYLNFAATRRSSLLEPFFTHFGVTPQSGSSASSLEEWLKANDISYKKQNLSEKRVAIRTKDEALENVCWHLEINGLKPDKNEIKKLFMKMEFGEQIEEEINSLMSLFVF